jgi:nicotinamide mononucleotide transporter
MIPTLDSILQELQQTSLIEYLAFTSLVLYVYYATKQKAIAWLLSLAGLILFVVINYRASLYGEIPLQGVYLLMSLYGWYQWRYGGKNQTNLPVSLTSLNLWVVLIIIGILGTIFLGHVLSTYTAMAIPYWDASTTAFSLVGTWMLARKKLENWVVWLIVDSAYTWIYVEKGLFLVTLLYFLYVVFSVVGLFRWYRTM